MAKDWLIVLDIDNTLIYYEPDVMPFMTPVIRPFVNEFIQEYRDRCEFALWTKGCSVYLREMSYVLSKYYNLYDWLFLWSFENCESDTKPLSKISKVYPKFDQKNTIFMDDLEANFALNEGWKCILVPPFKGEENDVTFLELAKTFRNIVSLPRVLSNTSITVLSVLGDVIDVGEEDYEFLSIEDEDTVMIWHFS